MVTSYSTAFRYCIDYRSSINWTEVVVDRNPRLVPSNPVIVIDPCTRVSNASTAQLARYINFLMIPQTDANLKPLLQSNKSRKIEICR